MYRFGNPEQYSEIGQKGVLKLQTDRLNDAAGYKDWNIISGKNIVHDNYRFALEQWQSTMNYFSEVELNHLKYELERKSSQNPQVGMNDINLFLFDIKESTRNKNANKS